jgi:hypothetical protein
MLNYLSQPYKGTQPKEKQPKTEKPSFAESAIVTAATQKWVVLVTLINKSK